MSSQFGKIPISAGVSILEDVGGTGLSGVLIGNESGLTCKVTLQGAGVVRTLYPGTVDFFEVPQGKTWSGNLQIDPSADLSNVSYWPGMYVYVDTFGPNERPSGIFPMALNRAGNIGNQVTTTVGSATSVQNDNNAAGTVFVESTVLGSPSSNTSISNEGAGWFGRWNNPTFTKIFQWFASGTTALKLGAIGFLTQVLGNLQVDGTATFNNAGVSIDSSNNFNGNAVNINTVNCTTVNSGSGGVNVNNNGNLSVTGTSSLDNGKITTDGNGHIVIPNAISYQAKNASGTAKALLWLDNTNTTQLQAADSDSIQIDDKTGATRVQVDNTGLALKVGKLSFVTTGSIKRIARFTGSNTATITHNWGEQADIVVPYYNGSFGTAPTQAIAVKNEGANSFDVVGQSGYSWTVLAIKF